jgi:transcriptional regulator with XRE-family HTH domain
MEPEPIARLKALGLSQNAIARCLGVGTSTLSQWALGTRKLPIIILEDLWALLRLVEERTRAGMDVHQAVQGWRGPTIRFSRGGQTVTPGVPIAVPEAVAEALSKSGPEEQDRFIMAETIAALAKASEGPWTAERLDYMRRLGLQVKMWADQALRFMEEG